MHSSLNHKILICWIKKHPKGCITTLLLIIASLIFWNSLPQPLFTAPYSTVLEDHEGQLLGARIAGDGQWRFPLTEKVPKKFEQALLEFEDRRFYLHPGVDPLAVGRATLQNIRAGGIVSGASTLSMQVIRLSRRNQARSFTEKVREMMLALRLELSYSKEEILALYAAHAPFGGNVVGLEAAAWRYFGRPPARLSWAEAAVLAVLPNSPSLIHPGRNRERLKAKRNRLLDRLLESGVIDTMTCNLAKAESLPGEPLPLPQLAPRLLDRIFASSQSESRVTSTLNRTLQQQAAEIVKRHHQQLSQNNIHNAAAIIADVETGAVRAYIGNTRDETDEHGNQVDVVTAPRSTGSILKPFLYMLMLNDGRLLPDMLVDDIPTKISGYAPENFDQSYDGAVPASEALARSLNVPHVRMLQDYGVPRFHHFLREMGMTTLNRPPEHYGLSLILGGAEGTLWDITGMYASLARHLNRYDATDPESETFTGHPLSYVQGEQPVENSAGFSLNAGAVWWMAEAMLEVDRPRAEMNWRRFLSSRKIGWKTGTSFGYRDGWAIGVTPENVIGVWVGNADGEGRPGLIGIKTAGPILFDLYDLLDDSGWFREPLYATEEAAVCSKSGYRAGLHCPKADTVALPVPGLQTPRCPFHRVVHLNPETKQRVNSHCMPVSEMKAASWFVLPPVQEWYYRRKHPTYRDLPSYQNNCSADEQVAAVMELIYPHDISQIYVPRELDGSKGRTVFQAAHRRSRSAIFWHLDDEFVGQTSGEHQIALSPEPGWHVLTLVDDRGATLRHRFEILRR